MKLPKEVKIGGHKYKVLFPCVELEQEGSEFSGKIDHSSKEIKIASHQYGRSDRCASALWVSFIHEVLHGIDYTSGNNTKERVICGFAEMIYQVLVDNGWLKKEMLE